MPNAYILHVYLLPHFDAHRFAVDTLQFVEPVVQRPPTENEVYISDVHISDLVICL